MKNNQQATHDHKRAGSVVVLESGGELAKVLIPATGDEFWVKLIDLTPLTSSLLKKAFEPAVASTVRNYSSPKTNKKRGSSSLLSSKSRTETVFQQAASVVIDKRKPTKQLSGKNGSTPLPNGHRRAVRAA